ncbi:MAG: hypothetical protein NT027_06370 [Proteobacteria bacterium]|nr:hypothetical protein [Pseudomonadota bacterium]
MRKRIFRDLCLGSILASISGISLASGAVLVKAPVEKVFVPQGFDDNDKVEVIVHGHFTSSCYKMGPVSAIVDDATKKLMLSVEAFYYPQATCLQMLVPYTKSIEVGRHLTAGIYKVEVLGSPQARSIPLNVVHATRPEADDFLYAAAYSALLEQTSEGKQEIVLKGQHPYLFDGCVRFEDIKSYVGADNVLVVQPITKIVYGEACATGNNPLNKFEERKTLNSNLLKGEYLMHVRVLDGNSINQFVEIE